MTHVDTREVRTATRASSHSRPILSRVTVCLLGLLLAAPAAAQTIDNGSFETADYSGWTLFEGGFNPSVGTWGIAQDGQTINFFESTFDFNDGLFVFQQSPGLPHTYSATDGAFVAYQLQNGPELHRMYQDISLCSTATNLTWDMEYQNHLGGFSNFQELAIRVRSLADIPLAVLFQTNPGDPAVVAPMTSFSADISAFAGQTVRLSVDHNVQTFFFDAAFDNFEVGGCDTPPPPPAAVRGIITSPNEFSGSESVIDFENLSVGADGVLTTEVPGVVFSMNTDPGPGLSSDAEPRMFGPSGDAALNNFPFPCGASGCGDITIDFDSPINRVGFEVRGLDPGDLPLTILCLLDGAVVGTASYTGGPDYRVFGVESDQVFDRVDILAMSPVSIDNLRFENDPTDSDGDGRIDPGDNCPDDSNPGQEDSDGDGFGDACFGPVIHDNGVSFLDDFDAFVDSESFQSTVNPGTFPVPEEPHATYILADDFVLTAPQTVGGARWIGTDEDRASGRLLPRVGETRAFRILFFDNNPAVNEPLGVPISERDAFAIRNVSVTGGRGHPRHSAYAPLYTASFSAPVLLTGGVRYWVAMVALDDFTNRFGVDGTAYGHRVANVAPGGNAQQGSSEFAASVWEDRSTHMAFSLLGAGPVAPPANLPPSCDSGGPYELVCEDGPMAVELDGTGSSDPDGTPISHDWAVSCAGASLDNSSSPTPLLTVQPPSAPSCASTSCTVDLTVSDGLLETQCLSQSVPVLPKPSVEDVTFINALTSVQVPPNTQSQVEVEFRNDGPCPSQVQSIDVLAAVGPSPVVSVAGVSPLLIGNTICPAGGTVTLTLDIDTTGLPEISYDRIVSITGQDSSVSANVEIVVGELKPDLTPISLSSSSVVIDFAGPPPLDVGEPATISVDVTNVGVVAAEAYDVNFFANDDLLGTVNGAAGLAPGASALAQLALTGSELVQGTYVIRVEVASSPGSESSLSNNAANAILQVGAETAGSDALIQVSAGATDACEDGIFRVSGHAQYILTSDVGGSPVLLSHVVQGGIVSVEVFAVGGGQPVRTSFTEHTNTNGDFSIPLEAPAAGDYFAVVEVKDLTLIGDDQANLEILSLAECTPPPPPPPAQVFTLSLNVCEKNAGGARSIEFADEIFTVDACVDPELLKGNDLAHRAAGNFAPAEITLASSLWTEDGAGGFTPETYETLNFTLDEVPDERTLSGIDCVAPPDTDGVFRLVVSDVNNVDGHTRDSSRGAPFPHPVTQAHLGAVSTGNLDLDVENLHTQGTCFSSFSVRGAARYVAASGSFADGLPVACGTVRASLLDPNNPSTVLATSNVGTTDANGGLGVAIGFTLVRDVTYPVQVEISDGVIDQTFQTTARCAATQTVIGVVGRPAPPVVTPTVQSQDMFVFAEDVVFLGNGTCTAGLIGTPEPGDELGIAATIHLEGNDNPISGQTITVREHLPVGGELVPIVIATPTVDFPAGVKEAQICVPWTPQTDGYRVIQVDIEPDQIVQYELNDAATRAIRIGTNPCLIELSERFLSMNRGGSSTLSVRGAHQEGVTPILDLALLPMPGDSLPPGLEAVFGSLKLVGNTVVSLTVQTTTETPPGRFPFAVVADGTVCTAISALTVVVNGLGPDLDPIPDQAVQCDALSVPLSASDPEGDALTFSASGFPSFVSLVENGNGATILIEPAASDTGLHVDLTVTASDEFDFFDSEVFQVEVTCNRPPVALCQEDPVVVDAGPTCAGSASVDAGSFDPDGDAITLTQAPAAPYSLGSTAVILTAADPLGASDQCAATVTVQDTTTPSVTPPTSISVEQTALGGTPASDAAIAAFLGGATASDVCDAAPVITNNAPASFPLGATRVTFTATDASGNFAQATATVTVQDTIPPVVAAPTSISVEQTALGGTPASDAAIAALLGGATASDVCDAAPVITNNAPASFPLGTTLVTFTAMDASGNFAQAAATVTVEDTTAPSPTPPANITVEQTLLGGTPATAPAIAAFLAGATATDVCDAAPAITNDAPASFPLGTTVVSFTATDASGNFAQATASVTVEDTSAPILTVDTTPITVEDEECSGDHPATLPTATATDVCDAALTLTDDAPATFPAGQTTTVTYTATDSSGNSITEAVDVTVLYGADIAIDANRHTVGTGSHPGSIKEPLVGIEVCAYDKMEGGCARTICGGITHHQYQCIVDSCGTDDGEQVSCCSTDASGECTINAPPGEYIVVSADSTGTVLPDPLGATVGGLACGQQKNTKLQQIVKSDGKKVPGKTSRLTGSELLVIEPEFVEWSGTEELYPFVFESAGDWSVSTSVAPPEGFVADHGSLSEQVTDELEAVQFVLTDVGSDWVPTEVKQVIDHKGRREVILSRIGVRLEPHLAAAKGLDRDGHVLDASGRRRPEVGFDPRAQRPAEIIGWIEPSAQDANWTVKLRVTESGDLTLAITRGQGAVVQTLAAGSFAPGDYEVGFDSESLGTGEYFLSVTAGESVQKTRLFEK